MGKKILIVGWKGDRNLYVANSCSYWRKPDVHAGGAEQGADLQVNTHINRLMMLFFDGMCPMWLLFQGCRRCKSFPNSTVV